MSDAHSALRSELNRGKMVHDALLKEVHTCCQHILGCSRKGESTMDSESNACVVHTLTSVFIHNTYCHMYTYFCSVCAYSA